VVKWRLSSAAGPSVGSLRAFVAAVNAGAGDTLVLAFNLDNSLVDVARIPVGETLDRRLHTLLGRPARSRVTALARGLDCQPDEVATVLRQRGDNYLADLLAADTQQELEAGEHC
jgi:hypothetical protein